MGHAQKTEKEVREAKAKAILAIKYGTLEAGSLAYWKALGDKEEVI